MFKKCLFNKRLSKYIHSLRHYLVEDKHGTKWIISEQLNMTLKYVNTWWNGKTINSLFKWSFLQEGPHNRWKVLPLLNLERTLTYLSDMVVIFSIYSLLPRYHWQILWRQRPNCMCVLPQWRTIKTYWISETKIYQHPCNIRTSFLIAVFDIVFYISSV